MGAGVIRIDHKSMDSLGVTAGDTLEVIGKKDGVDARCYPLLPSDENQGITRIDPDIRKAIGISLEDTVTIRNLAPVSPEQLASEEQALEKAVFEENKMPEYDGSYFGAADESDSAGTTSSLFTLSGSCIDFESERSKLMGFMTTLESFAHNKSKSRCYSDGKKSLGWDFFILEVDQGFVKSLSELYPDIGKQEAGTLEDRFALWLNKQLKKKALEFHLKLADVPQEKVNGFRLDPERFRDDKDLKDLR